MRDDGRMLASGSATEAVIPNHVFEVAHNARAATADSYCGSWFRPSMECDLARFGAS